jgi:hypothetical protein
MPRSGVQRGKRFPREIAGAALAAGGSLQRLVVQQDRHVVLRELHVELVRVVAQRLADFTAASVFSGASDPPPRCAKSFG